MLQNRCAAQFECCSYVRKFNYLLARLLIHHRCFRFNCNIFINMEKALWSILFSFISISNVFGDRWQTSASFSKHNSVDKNMKLYDKPPPAAPLPLQTTYPDYDLDEKMKNTFEADHQSFYNPYPDFFYPPVNIPRPANDVLVIILEQNMKCSNETQTAQPPQPTPKIFPPPSRCIWAIVACCAPTSVSFRYSCFNFLGCSGTYWQINPCQLPIIMLAVNEATAYYKQFEPQPAPIPPPPTEPPANANTTEVPSPETTVAASTATNVETTTVSEAAPAKIKVQKA